MRSRDSPLHHPIKIFARRRGQTVEVTMTRLPRPRDSISGCCGETPAVNYGLQFGSDAKYIRRVKYLYTGRSPRGSTTVGTAEANLKFDNASHGTKPRVRPEAANYAADRRAVTALRIYAHYKVAYHLVRNCRCTRGSACPLLRVRPSERPIATRHWIVIGSSLNGH